MTGARGRRLDWSAFFQTVPEPHGLRLRLSTVDASSPAAITAEYGLEKAAATAEKRVLRLIRSRLASERFALRRSFSTGPTVIECVFDSAPLADALAREVGAGRGEAVPGWTSVRTLVADERALRQLLKQGAAAVREDLQPDELVAHRPGPIDEARSRLQSMSLEEQAAALFKSMTRAP